MIPYRSAVQFSEQLAAEKMTESSTSPVLTLKLVNICCCERLITAVLAQVPLKSPAEKEVRIRKEG